eukprot:g6416.t1
MSKTIFVIFTLFASSLAACPNKCSGHGTCDLGDRCHCQPRFIGPDCSQRQCAYGLSWVTSSDTTSAAAGSVKLTDLVNGGDLIESGVTSADGADTTTIHLDHTKENGASTTANAYLGMRISFLGTGISTTITAYAGSGVEATVSAMHSTISKGTPYVITSDANTADVGRHSYTACSST